MFQSFRFKGQVTFENSTSIKSWLLKSVSLFYIDICFPSSVNEGHSVDTRFCTYDLIKKNDLNNHPCTPKIMTALHASICDCITCINSFIAYHKNYLEVLTVTMVCPVFQIGPSDRKISHDQICMVNMHCVQVESTTHD